MEYCDGGDLAGFLKTHPHVSEAQAQYFLQQLALALAYLRKHEVAHFDLKPQNILLSTVPGGRPPILKLADFGFAVPLRGGVDELRTSLRGSPL